MSRFGAVLLSATIGLAGCGGDVVMRTQIPKPGTNDVFVYAASSGEMATEIIGNPFAAPKEEVDAAVLAAMAGSYAGPDVRFTTDASPAAPEGYVIVVLLDGPQNMPGNLLCRNRSAAKPQPTEGLTTVVIAFCAGKSVMNAVNGRVAAVTSPHDSAFRAMIAHSMIELIPTREQELNDLRR